VVIDSRAGKKALRVGAQNAVSLDTGFTLVSFVFDLPLLLLLLLLVLLLLFLLLLSLDEFLNCLISKNCRIPLQHGPKPVFKRRERGWRRGI
jgi:hypothetical protein